MVFSLIYFILIIPIGLIIKNVFLHDYMNTKVFNKDTFKEKNSVRNDKT